LEVRTAQCGGSRCSGKLGVIIDSVNVTHRKKSSCLQTCNILHSHHCSSPRANDIWFANFPNRHLTTLFQNAKTRLFQFKSAKNSRMDACTKPSQPFMLFCLPPSSLQLWILPKPLSMIQKDRSQLSQVVQFMAHRGVDFRGSPTEPDRG
jgi:hypothetical protein